MRRGPWRGLCFLLLACVLVQADAMPPADAARRFAQERVLPFARRAEARAAPWRARLGEALASVRGLEPVVRRLALGPEERAAQPGAR